MIINEKERRIKDVLSVAGHMMTAARTAPKAKGVDRLEIVTVYGDDLKIMASVMRELSEESGLKFFLRDANNIEIADAVMVIGTSLGVFNLNCTMCGFETCGDKMAYEAIPCAFNMIDLGIALGSAASIAADHRVDTRIMWSVGAAAKRLGWVGDCPSAAGIALSCSGKNPFFDRVTPKDPIPGK